MGAQAIGSLYAQLGLDTASFDTGIAKARGKLSDFGKVNFSGALKAGLGEIDGALKSTAGQAGALGSVLGGLGIAGTAAAAAIAVAFTGARSAMAFGDEIADTANKLRVTTDYLQEMRFAAHQLGGEFTDADEALEGFTRAFGLAKSGLSAKAIKPFAALGLDPKSFETVQQALDAVIDKIAGLGDAAEQAAVADKLGLTPLLPAIREGTGAIDDLRQAAHDLGYVMDASLIEKAGDANDKFEALQAVLDVQFKSAMVDAIPLVMQLTEWMVGAAKAAGDFANDIQNVSDKLADLATHDLRGNAVKNDRDKLFGAMAQRSGLRRIASAADPVGQGGVSLENMQALFGAPPAAKPTGQLVDLEGLRRKEADAERAAAAAERERKAALKALSDTMHEAEKHSVDYAASLLDDITTMGMSADQVRRHQTAIEAAAAPTAALSKLIADLGAKYEAQARVGREAADVQKTVKDQQSDTITTMRDAIGPTVTMTSRTEALAMEMEDMARISQDVGWGIQNIADAINDNDWVSAFAGFTRVLAQVEKAFDANTEAAKRYAAIAGVAVGVGNAIGGTGGSVLSGAGSGAMAGLGLASSLTTLGLAVPGPGWALAAVGGILGGIGGLFGSSKAKKQAKKQATAQAAAAEAQRQQQIGDAKYNIQLSLLQAQGKAEEALALSRQHELDALAKLDPSLVELQKQLYAAQDASDAAAKAAERAAEVEAGRSAIQDQIDKLTLSSSELLAKTRAKERAEAVALDPALGDLIDKLYGLQDSADATAAATAAQQAANDAATEAMNRQAEAARAVADMNASVISSLYELSHSLRQLAGDLGDQLGLIGDSYDAAKAALLAGAKGGSLFNTPGLIDAFLKSSQARFGNSKDYLRDVALSRSVASFIADWADSSARTPLWATAIPGFATGGSMVIGGNSGVDQNLLSLNGAPVARVGYGETLSVSPRGASNDNDMAAVVAELRALRSQVANLQESNSKMERTLTNVTEGGRAMQTEVAS